MENASNALIMAAGVLIGILILSLAVFLFSDFGATTREINSKMEEKQLSEYNAQYTVYVGREDVTIYDIITIVNLARENNNYYKDFSNYEKNYKVTVKLDGKAIGDDKDEETLIKDYGDIDANNGEFTTIFKGDEPKYHTTTGRIKIVEFSTKK